MRILDAQVAEPANTLDGDHLAGPRPRIPQRVEDRNARAHKGPGLPGRELIRDRGDGLGRSGHVFGVAAVEADSRNFPELAHGEIATPATFTLKAVPSVPSHTNPLTHFPIRNVGGGCVDSPSDLMSGHARILEPRPFPPNQCIGVTDATGLHLDANFAGPGFRNIAIHNFPIATGFADLCGFHASHESSFLRILLGAVG